MVDAALAAAGTPAFACSAIITADAALLYRLIADYHEGHPRILPRPPFVDLVVEQGGVGAGTVVLSRMKVLGSVQSFRASIAEPEPGRRLVETTDTGYVTTFLVESLGAGRSRVTLHTTAPDKTGWLGRMEFALTRRLLLPAYERELHLLAEAAEARVESLLPA